MYSTDTERKKLTPLLRGDRIIKGRELFTQEKIYYTNYVENAPVFDYFEMVDGGNFKKVDDWILLDCYGFIGYKVPISGICVSPKFKEVLEQFYLMQPTIFYPCKVMYKGRKLTFYIFHCAINLLEHINYSKSNSILTSTKTQQKIADFRLPASYDLFLKYRKDNLPENARISFLSYYLDKYVDLLPFNPYAISERLKNAIEEAGLTGVEIKAINDIGFEFENGIPS